MKPLQTYRSEAQAAGRKALLPAALQALCRTEASVPLPTLEGRRRLGRQLEPGLQFVHRGLNMRAVLVGVPLDHR